MTDTTQMKTYWVSIWLPERLLKSFEYHGPWWISGERDSEGEPDHSIVAWVMAENEAGAYETLRLAVDEGPRPDDIIERFADHSEAPDRTNSSGRFEFANWMKWPWPEKPLEPRP